MHQTHTSYVHGSVDQAFGSASVGPSKRTRGTHHQGDTSHLAVYLGCCDILAVERLAALLIYILDGLECCQREAVAGEA
jgi:hypothetical protein